MGFIRQYAAMSGDPFRFRLPRIIRPPKRLKQAFSKVGKVLGKALPVAAGFVPGVGGIASGLLAGRGRSIQQDMAPIEPQIEPMAEAPVFTSPIRRRAAVQMPLEVFEPEPEETDDYDEEDQEAEMSDYDRLLAFARGYGWQGDPVRKKAPIGKLAKASAPPSVHASAKKTNRKKKLRGTADPRGGSAKRRGANIGASVGAGLSAVGRGLKAGGPAALAALQHADIGALFGATQAGSRAADVRGLHGFQMGGHRRHINPANVKALRRGIRRLEGFEKLVKSVRKAAGGLRGVVMQPHGVRHYKKPGHRAGCRCVACRGR